MTGTTAFVPFADYGAGDAGDPAAQPALTGTDYVRINATDYTCKRDVSITNGVATITLTVTWLPPRGGATVSRVFQSTASLNGINDLLFVPPATPAP